jgi:hypothetical protein
MGPGFHLAFAGATLKPAFPPQRSAMANSPLANLYLTLGRFAGQCFRKQHAYETGWQSEGNEMKHFAAQQNPQKPLLTGNGNCAGFSVWKRLAYKLSGPIFRAPQLRGRKNA